MPAQLVALNDGPSILLDKPILLLGRDLECDIRLDSRKISRRHCCIAQVGEQLVVRDLGSTNGIRINGVRVMEGHLSRDDELTIGNYRYKVHWIGGHVRAASALKDGRAAGGAKAAADDDLLEASDEPVALAESVEGALSAPRAQALPASEPIIDAVPPGSPRTPGAFPKYETIIPDSLELAPPSDHLPNPAAAPAADSNHRLPPAASPENGDAHPGDLHAEQDDVSSRGA